jgi:transcription initiation factor IIE alpha subunit
MILYSLLRNNSSRKVISELCSFSALTNKDLCEKTGLAKSTVSEIIQRFVNNHVIQFELSDSGVKIQLQDRSLVAKLLKNSEVSRDVTVVDNFIDLWDF